MSWFDAAGLANIAKSALKEAQRTIDKALDIKDEDSINIKPLEDNKNSFVENQPKINHEIEDDMKKNEVEQNINSNSVWGSFTGSFFDHSKELHKSSLDDTTDINFTHSKLVVEKIEECDNLEDNSNKNETVSSQIIEDSHCVFESATDLPSENTDSTEFFAAIQTVSVENSSDGNVLSSLKASFPEAITVPPSRKNEQLPFDETKEEKTVSTQPQSYRKDDEIPVLLKCSNVIDIPLSEDNEMEVSTESDKTLKDSSETQDRVDSLQNLLAEAISDKDSVRSVKDDAESSPMSSEKSDMVKIGSDQTSGDELETATSSDIEIISNPNCDSSSTQSRQSPAKVEFRKMKEDSCKLALENIKRHNREPSGASSLSDDTELDKVTRKLGEMTEILESRESKIVEITRKNAELQELNLQLKTHLDSLLNKQAVSQDLTQVTEDYAQRMSVLEKKFQQVIREKDNLRKLLEQSKQDASFKLSKNEVEATIIEKDEMIKQLRDEGEKLSKQQLQHSNIIKKLRAKEKENESTIKQLKETVDDLTKETERLKRNVNAKEEIERTQIEAVNQLTSKNKKLETDFEKLRSELDDQIQKYETLKTSLDAARKELNDKNRITHQLSAKEQLLESLENEKKVAVSQNEEVVNQLQYSRLRMQESEREYTEKERFLRNENKELLSRLEMSESRNEELAQSVLEVSKPLVRQLETLQATHNMKLEHFERLEKQLTDKISELQFRLNNSLGNERTSTEECVELRSKYAKLEVEFNSLNNQKNLLEIRLEQTFTEKTMLEQELRTKIEELDTQLISKNNEITQLLLRHKEVEEIEEVNSNPRSTSSPTLSVKADSLVSSVWSQLENEANHPPRYSTNLLEIQMLQTNLQQREGELQQLQWELNRREQERNLINSELTLLMSKVDDLTNKLTDYDETKLKFDKLKGEYDVLCQMYGEKVDEVEELKLDLLEAKEAYKSQLDELLRNQNSS